VRKGGKVSMSVLLRAVEAIEGGDIARKG
jgi:hypothetical protein